ncbi:MAG: hypothetical protein ABIB11_04585, partial [Candidatus Omnitrophota bacterium]
MLRKLFIYILVIVMLTPQQAMALRPVSSVISSDLSGSYNSINDLSYLDISEYYIIEYRNGVFSVKKEDTERSLIQISRYKRFFIVLLCFLGITVLLNFAAGYVFNKSILQAYIECYNARRFVVSGITASSIGAVSEISGL